MKELVVISGKGGTGKTSVVAALATLAGPCVLADCDVDAADLHLIFEPKLIRCADFIGGAKARIKPEYCNACGKCEKLCRFDAVYHDGPGNGRTPRTFRIETTACEGCGVCVDYCDENAIEFAPGVCGQWFVSEARCGLMVHAKLGIAAENSGKLVTLVRQTAQEVAYQHGLELVFCDGSPGIGCPVIASLTGASLALFVVEPTVSGIHDFCRIAQLAARLDVPGLLVINKADLNEKIAEEIETTAVKHGILLAGKIPYLREVTRAQIARKTVVEFSDGPAAQAIRAVWAKTEKHLQSVAASTIDGLVQIQPSLSS
ncbi:MAG: ATP-binding protein [Thermoguttaceae bacterium]